MNELNWWDKFLVDASNFALEAWNKWSSLPPECRVGIGFSAIALCAFLLVFVYSSRLRKARLRIEELEDLNLVLTEENYDLQEQVDNACGNVLLNEEGQDIEFSGGVPEEFVLEVIGRIQSMNSEAIEALKDTVGRLTDCVERGVLTAVEPEDEEPNGQ